MNIKFFLATLITFSSSMALADRAGEELEKLNIFGIQYGSQKADAQKFIETYKTQLKKHNRTLTCKPGLTEKGLENLSCKLSESKFMHNGVTFEFKGNEIKRFAFLGEFFPTTSTEAELHHKINLLQVYLHLAERAEPQEEKYYYEYTTTESLTIVELFAKGKIKSRPNEEINALVDLELRVTPKMQTDTISIYMDFEN